MSQYLKLMLITNKDHTTNMQQYLEFLEQTVKGGVTSIQVRQKNYTTEETITFSSKIKEILVKYPDVGLLINDNLEVAKKVEATGIHVGRQDATPENCRKELGANALIGLSIESMQQLAKANSIKNLNYIAASSIFPTQNKINIKTLWGTEGLIKIKKLSSIPVVAIGGINLSNIKQILNTGADGIALIGALHNSTSPAKDAEKIRKIIDEHQHKIPIN